MITRALPYLLIVAVIGTVIGAAVTAAAFGPGPAILAGSVSTIAGVWLLANLIDPEGT